MRRTFLVFGIALTLSAQYQNSLKVTWLEPGGGDVLPEFDAFDSSNGELGVLNASGSLKTDGHPFFTALGTNGRACVTCHQPAWGMSISASGLADRWRASGGKDPVFAAFDGSNCPGLPQQKESSHSLLLKRGLFRIPLTWPPRNADGSPKPVEFTIEGRARPHRVQHQLPEYGLKSAQPTISVYRRPRMAANLKYVVSGGSPIVLKTGMLADVDPETGKAVSMNLMSDAREVSLRSQAMSAVMGHEEARTNPSRQQIEKIIEFESQVYVAQAGAHIFAGPLAVPVEPRAWALQRCATIEPGVLGDNDYDPVFGKFDEWKGKDYYQSSIARGADIFMHRQFWLRDATHINSIGLGNPLKRTCATCHNAQMTGQDLSAGWVDVGTTNYPTWTEPATWAETSELPVFKITCSTYRSSSVSGPGHLFHGSGPGAISGRCVDVGSIVMQQLRGLSARAPTSRTVRRNRCVRSSIFTIAGSISNSPTRRRKTSSISWERFRQ